MFRKTSASLLLMSMVVLGGIQTNGWTEPLMSPEIALTDVNQWGEYPDVAYNPGSNQYLVVWKKGSQGLRGRFVRSGEPMGNVFEITGAYQIDGAPRVAFDPSRMRYLVVWSRGGDGGFMYGRFIPWNGPNNDLEEFIIEPVVKFYGAALRQYGVAHSPIQDDFLVVWTTRYLSPSTYFPTVGRWVRADGSGFTGNTFFVAHQPPDNRSYPAVAYNSVRDHYLVATHDYPRLNDNIYGVRVSGNGPVYAEFTIAGWPDDEAMPAAAACPQQDQYLVVWDSIQTSRPQPYPRGVYARFIAGNGALGGVNEIVHWDEYWNNDVFPDAACGMYDMERDDPRYLVVYRPQSPDGLWGREVYLDGTMGANFQIGTHADWHAVAGGRINHLVAWSWAGIRVRFIGNTVPRACFSVAPEEGSSDTEFRFDASCTADATQPASALQVRWDWNHDGIYDTLYSYTKTASHRFTLPPGQSAAVFSVQMQVTDGKGETDTVSSDVIVYGISDPPALPAIHLLFLDD